MLLVFNLILFGMYDPLHDANKHGISEFKIIN